MANKDALIKLQAEYYQLESQEGSEKRLNEIQNQIQNGVMKMLGITAPNEEKSLECQKIAASIEPHLTEKQIDLCKKGIEVCLELL